MAEDVGIAGRSVVRVKPDDDQTGSVRSYVEAYPIDSVRQQYRHTVASLDVLLCERDAVPLDAVGNHAPRVIAPAPFRAVVVAVGNGVGAAPDTFAKKAPQRARLASVDHCIAGEGGPLRSLGDRRVHRCHNSLAARANDF